MSTLYFDCISGIAGDMALASLIDLGADLSYIEGHLKQLPIDPFDMRIETVTKQGIAAKQLRLDFTGDAHDHEHPHAHGHHDHTHHHGHPHELGHAHGHQQHQHRSAAEILDMIERSSLPLRVKERSQSIFQIVAVAEGKIHGVPPEEVHFHEVGAMDSIIDIIGVCLALENLEIDKMIASPVPTGQGKVRMAHGIYPIPAPATAELLTGIPIAKLDVQGELTTPTGAAILKALATKYSSIESFTIQRIGYGAGEKEFDHPNVLRAMLVK